MPAIIPAVAGIAGAAISANGAKKAAQSQADAIKEANKQDPRIDQMLYGANGSDGLLNRYQGLLDKGPSAAANAYTNASGNYLSQYGGTDMGAARDAAYKAMGGNSAPMAQASQMTGAQAQGAQAQAAGAGLNAYAVGNMVDAPSQNNMDLSGAYDRFINGTPGANQYLDQSINGAIAQNRLGFNQLQDDATENLMKNIMPSIRSNSVLTGQYGGSRQGIAEGNAIGQIGKEMARAGAQFGQNATNAAVGAKANAYETDSNRALSATQGLGAQQYGVAQQNAQTKNQAEFMNVGNNYDLGKFNAGLQQQTNLTNANSAQQNNQFNAGLQQQTGQYNAGLQQQTNLANQGAQLSTNAQNNGSLLAGAGLLSGLTNQASSTVNANDNAEMLRAQQVNGLLQPYLSRNPSGQVAPAANTGAAALGGGLAGLSLGNSLAGMFDNKSTPFPYSYSGPGITAQPMTSVPQTQIPFMGSI